MVRRARRRRGKAHEGRQRQTTESQSGVAHRLTSATSRSFRRVVERSVNRADYPFAHDVVSNVLVYDGLEARGATASSEARKELMAEWVDALTDGPGIIAIRGAFADLTAIDQANPAFLGDHRRGALEQRRRRRPFRQARRQLPHLERAREAVPARPGGICDILWQRGHCARERGLARPGLSDHFAAQRRQSGRRGAGRASRLPSRLPVSSGDRDAFPFTSSVFHPC